VSKVVVRIIMLNINWSYNTKRLCVITLSVIMLNFNMLCAIKLIVILLNVIFLKGLPSFQMFLSFYFNTN
jgi:hypothetical protein